jgi:hypothetical protein
MNTTNKELPKTYQKPKANHPWRQYRDKILTIDVEIDIERVPLKTVIPLREFLSDMVNNWENYTVTLNVSFEGTNQHQLKTLPANKQAAWLSGILRREYGTN